MQTKKMIFLFISIVLSFHNVFAEVKGSTTAVSIEPAYEFPAADSNNTMLGFGWFKNGFSLEDNTTTCTFDTVYPVSGDVDLNGGTLYLVQDLIFKNKTTFLGLGTIVGENHLCEFCSSIQQLPAQKLELQDIEISLSSDLIITDSIILKGNCKFFGHGYDIVLGQSGCIIVDSDSELHLSHLIVDGIYSDNFIMKDDTSSLVVENIVWKQAGDYTFDKGSITFLNKNDFIGAYDFVYDSKLVSTISNSSSWSIKGGLNLKIGRKDSIDDSDPLYFQDSTSILRLDGCSFIVTDYGMMLKKGKIEVDSDVNLEIMGTTTSTGLVLGSGQQEEDFIMHLNSGASLKFKSGQLMYNNYGQYGLTALSESARVIRYGPSKMYIANDWVFPSLVLKVHSGIPETIIKEGVLFSYDNSKIVFSSVEYDFSGHQSGSYNFYLNGDDYLYLSKGTFITPLVISGTNNAIYGTGNVAGNIVLQDSDSEFSVNLNGLVLGDIYLNDGTVKLAGDFSLGSDTVFVGDGTVDLSSYNFQFSGLDSLWTGTINFKNASGALTLQSTVSLDGQWVFEDSCVINGNNHTLDIGLLGRIVIKDGVQLTLRDVAIHTVSEEDIKLLSDTSSIVLDNVTWVQDADITFDTGSMKFVNNVVFSGAYDFHYDSSRTSTIAANSQWKITGEMALKMGRKEAQDYVEPLYFENSTSSLGLDSCTLIVTGSGMQFTRGRIDLDKDVNLEIMGTTVDTGLVLGNGQEEHDFSMYLYSGLSLQFRSGQLVYNNYNSDKTIALSESARLIRYGPSKIYLATDLVFPSIHLKVDSGLPVTELAEGVNFTYDKSKIIFENVEFDFKGKQSGSSVFLLEGGDYLYLSKGLFMLPFTVSGPANQIFGSGNLAGQVVLQDSNSELICYLNGMIWNEILLNDGSLTLYDDLRLGGDFTIEGPGQVRLMRYNVILGGQDSVWASTIDWHSNGEYLCPYNFPRGIDLNSKVTLAGKWNMQDCCVIDGHSQMLDLGDTGQIEVQEDVCLTLRNMTIHSSGENQIYCVDDSGRITFDNVTWLQDSDVIFEKGSMKFINNVDFIGSGSFVYDSCLTSTIDEGSCWKITHGMTFRMGRQEKENSAEPLYFTNKTSILKFDEANFIVTGSGMTLTRGVIEVDREVNLEILGTTTSTGLTVGTGVESEDAKVQANSGASLRFRSGQLTYNNYGPDGIVALSKNARFIRYAPSKTYINRDWAFPQMTLRVADGFPETVLADGVSFRYNNTKFVFENAKFDFTGRQYHSSVFCMEGNNDFLYFSKGLCLMPIAVSGAGNLIHGTGNLNGPVILQDGDTDLMFNLSGEVWNNIVLNDSVITLYNNLCLGGDYIIEGAGQVRLNRYNVVLGGQDSVWESTISWHSNGVSPCPYNYPRGIDLNAKVMLTGKWNIQDNCVINGNGNMLCLGELGKIEVQEGVGLTFRNIILHTKGENNIYCTSDNSSIIFDNVTWLQDSDVTFSKGSMKFENNVDFVGPHSFIYDSCKTSTIGDSSCWKITNGMTLSIGKKEQESSEPLYFTNKTSVLKLDNCSFLVTGSGMSLTRGIVEVDRDVTLDIVGTTTANGLMLGNGIEEDDLTIQADSGTAFMFKSGQMVFNNYSKSLITPLSESARFIRYGPSKVYIKSSVEFPEMTLKVASGFPETVLADGVSFSYKNSHIIFSNVAFDYTGVQYHSNTFALTGGNYIYLDKGVFMLPITVGGPSNMIFGAGSFSGPIMLQDSDAELTFGLNGNIGGSVMLNSGKIILSDDLNLSGGVHFIGAGQVNLSGYRLSFGSRDIICEGAKSWDGGDGGSIDIRSKIDLRDTWTFSNSCIINGHGNTIDLSNNGKIIIEKGANLVFQDIKILGVSDTNIRCLDDDGVITLDDVTWVQDGSYTFTAGSFRVKNNTKMEGTHDFYYQTIMPTTVLKDSSWKFGPGFTFNYDPMSESVESKDLIQFTDETSYLKFNNANLHVSPVGINFKKGNIVARGECNFSSEDLTLEDETTISEGITVGSGEVQDDCVCTISVGSILNFVQGAFVYNNISAASFIMENQISHLGILSNTELRLNQNLNLGEGILYMSEAATFNFVEGKNIIGTVFFVE